MPQSRALASSPLPLGLRLRPVDPARVTAESVGGFLVAGDVHQLQVVRGEEQAVEVLPVYLPAALVLGRLRQRGDNGALLLYSAKGGQRWPFRVVQPHRHS